MGGRELGAGAVGAVLMAGLALGAGPVPAEGAEAAGTLTLVVNSTANTGSDAPKGANRQPIDLGWVKSSTNWSIINSTFSDIRVDALDKTEATIELSIGASPNGTNLISGNRFDNAKLSVPADKQGVAIYWNSGNSSLGNTVASNLVIEDNEFDGYHAETIRLHQTGTVPVRRNVFGTATKSQSPADKTENEEAATSDAMMVNASTASDRKILTWYPQDGTVTLVNCELQVVVVAPTGTPAPKAPVTLDFYWTAGATAETHLGTVEGLTQGGTVTVPELPPAKGYIRLQTQGSGNQPESSQYSRTVTNVSSINCPPSVEIDLR
ncbi:MAG: hypothetical protein LBC97_13080, partial [Bifidobacteriaceae bacterium]|nr:hypothetical protein [Bifidobacteriaceae bacterium]